MFTVAVGTNAYVHGICCLAVGDNTVARGAYQVSIGEKVTIPDNLSKASAIATFNEVKELKLTFQAMVRQKVAPPEFGVESTKALDVLVGTLEKHFGKGLNELIEDVKNETLEKQPKETVVDEKGAGSGKTDN
jgi:hypothetical protein